MRWDGHVEDQDDPNGHAQLIRLCDWGSRPISWLWEPLFPKRKVTLLAPECASRVLLRRSAHPPPRLLVYPWTPDQYR